MPTIGPFHRFYWKARANPIIPPGVSAGWMYPGVQSVVTMCAAFAVMPPAIVWRWLRRTGVRLVWMARMAWRIWQWRDWDARITGHAWTGGMTNLDVAQLAALEAARAVVTGPLWSSARMYVEAASTSPGFHEPKAWVEYSRAIKANTGQAQNIFRHLKVVQALTASHPELTNPDAHLLAELAYQAFAQAGRSDRRIAEHPKRHKDHPTMEVA